jgi:hypothetical protein
MPFFTIKYLLYDLLDTRIVAEYPRLALRKNTSNFVGDTKNLRGDNVLHCPPPGVPYCKQSKVS